jgi:hypothetical protein
MRWSARMEDAFRQLLRPLDEHRVRVVLHQPPMHPGYYSYMDQHPKARENYLAFVHFVRGLAGPNVHVRSCGGPEELGLREEDFVDGQHLGRPGAETYTRAIGQFIKDEHLLSGQAMTRASRDPDRP